MRSARRMITTVIFDLGEVLLNAIRDSGRRLADEYGINNVTTPEQAVFSYYGLSHPLLVPAIVDFIHGKILEDEYITAVLATYPQLVAVGDLKKYIRDNFSEVAGTRKIILRLRQQGFKLGLLSTHAREWIEYCQEKFRFIELFDQVSFSYEEGVSKPDPKAYQTILTKLGSAPQECVFIDDTPDNVSAAQAIGMNGIVFTSAAELDIMLARLLPNYVT